MVLHTKAEHAPLFPKQCEEIAKNKGYDELYEPIGEVADRQLCDGALIELEDGSDAVVISDLGGIRRRQILVQFISGGCDTLEVNPGTKALVTISKRHIRVKVLKA